MDWAKAINIDLVELKVVPFSLKWSIFPAGKRKEAEEAAQTGYSGLYYIANNVANNLGRGENSWANCEVNFTRNYWVPAPDHSCWEFYGYPDERNYPQFSITPESGPCPRPEPGSGDEDNRRRLSFDEPEPEVSTCGL